MSYNATKITDLTEFFSVKWDGKYVTLEFKKAATNVVVYDPGLAHTAICKSNLIKINKNNGTLYYRDIPLQELLEEDFIDIASRIIFESNEKKLRFKIAVHTYFQLIPEVKNIIDVLPFSTSPMDILGIVTIALASIESKYLKDLKNNAEQAGFLVAQIGVIVTYLYTKMNNIPWVKPQSNLSFAEKILFQMNGGKNLNRLHKLGKLFNSILILHAEHGQTCSTAAVRTVASARSSLYTSISAGIAAFNGPIHGGASQFVSTMYEEIIQNNLNVEEYIKIKLSNKQPLMGFGHRIYNRIGCWDSRAFIMYKILTNSTFEFLEINEYTNIALKLIQCVTNNDFFKKRNLAPNPDLFNCIFFKLFGAPKEMNTSMIVISRVVGWIANFIEHLEDNLPITRPCEMNKNSK